MREEIKFRAWQGGEMLTMPITTIYGIWKFFGMLNDETPIMQFTGLKDKNGKEIYEGDILRHPVNFLDPVDMHTFEIFTVEFKNGSFVMSDSIDGLWDWNEGAEIIGNIYEHPHLLTPLTQH